MPLRPRVVSNVKLPHVSALHTYLVQFAYIAEGQLWRKRSAKLVSSGELPGHVFQSNDWWHCFLLTIYFNHKHWQEAAVKKKVWFFKQR